MFQSLWITHPDAVYSDNRIYLFRKAFRLESSPSSAPLNISAEARYKLFINGRRAACGPCRSSGEEKYYDTFDAAPYLREGDNEVFCEVLQLADNADMTKPLPFANDSFDVVINPVSLCYVRELDPIWSEVARVLRPGGVFLGGFDSGYNYIVDEAEERIVRGLPYDPVADPQLLEQDDPDECGVQFSHTPGELLGGMLRAGFVIDDVFDDVNGEGRLSELGIPTMLAVRAHLAR